MKFVIRRVRENYSECLKVTLVAVRDLRIILSSIFSVLVGTYLRREMSRLSSSNVAILRPGINSQGASEWLGYEGSVTLKLLNVVILKIV